MWTPQYSSLKKYARSRLRFRGWNLSPCLTANEACKITQSQCTDDTPVRRCHYGPCYCDPALLTCFPALPKTSFTLHGLARSEGAYRRRNYCFRVSRIEHCTVCGGVKRRNPNCRLPGPLATNPLSLDLRATLSSSSFACTGITGCHDRFTVAQEALWKGRCRAYCMWSTLTIGSNSRKQTFVRLNYVYV